MPNEIVLSDQDRNMLVLNVPCVKAERHTFAPYETYCLCGSLRCLVPHPTPTVYPICPATEIAEPQ